MSSVTSRKATFNWSIPNVLLLSSIYGAEIKLTNKVTNERRIVQTFSASNHTIMSLDEGTEYDATIVIKTSTGLIPTGNIQFKTKIKGQDINF